MSALDRATSTDIEALYGAHHGWLQSWLRRRLGNACDAADLAHDTFVRVMGKLDIGEVREPRAYLATIAGGLVNNHWRRQALERAYLEALAAQPLATAPSTEERLLILEALEEMARLLDGLPPQVRAAFLLSQLDGMTYPQIAEQLGITVNVVQNAMRRTMAQCYRVLYD